MAVNVLFSDIISSRLCAPSFFFFRLLGYWKRKICSLFVTPSNTFNHFYVSNNFLFISFQEIMRQSSAKLDDLLLAPQKSPTPPSATDEETAIAALTALRNNNHHLNFHHQQHQQQPVSNCTNNTNNTNNNNTNSSRNSDTSSPPVTVTKSSSSSVTSLISKIHLQNLEANSVSGKL